jgi:hypothetical protein
MSMLACNNDIYISDNHTVSIFDLRLNFKTFPVFNPKFVAI